MSAVVVVSVWLPLKMCSRDQEFTNRVRIFFRVSSFVLNTWIVLFLLDTFSAGTEILMCSPLFEFVMTLVASRPEDAFFDLITISILGVLLLSIAVKIALCILFSTVSTILPISLSIFQLKHLSKCFTLTKFSLAGGLLSKLQTVIFRSQVFSLTVAFCCLSLIFLPLMNFRSKSSI